MLAGPSAGVGKTWPLDRIGRVSDWTEQRIRSRGWRTRAEAPGRESTGWQRQGEGVERGGGGYWRGLQSSGCGRTKL